MDIKLENRFMAYLKRHCRFKGGVGTWELQENPELFPGHGLRKPMAEWSADEWFKSSESAACCERAIAAGAGRNRRFPGNRVPVTAPRKTCMTRVEVPSGRKVCSSDL